MGENSSPRFLHFTKDDSQIGISLNDIYLWEYIKRGDDAKLTLKVVKGETLNISGEDATRLKAILEKHLITD